MSVVGNEKEIINQSENRLTNLNERALNYLELLRISSLKKSFPPLKLKD